MEYNTDRYILIILGESVSALVILTNRAVAVSILKVRSERMCTSVLQRIQPLHVASVRPYLCIRLFIMWRSVRNLLLKTIISWSKWIRHIHNEHPCVVSITKIRSDRNVLKIECYIIMMMMMIKIPLFPSRRYRIINYYLYLYWYWNYWYYYWY